MSKRLEIDYIDITKVSFGEKTQLCGSELTINKQELISQFDTSSFDTVEIFIASPGDDVRILGLTTRTLPFPAIWGSWCPPETAAPWRCGACSSASCTR